jgi:hypothetical protein
VLLIQAVQRLGVIDKDKNAKYLTINVQIQITGLRIFTKMSSVERLFKVKIDDIFNHYPLSFFL